MKWMMCLGLWLSCVGTSEANLAEWFPKADFGIGWNFDDSLVTVRGSLTVVKWDDLIEFPRVGFETTDKATLPALDIGVDLKTLAERLGGEWKMPGNFSATFYATVDPFIKKPIFSTLKIGVSVVVIEIKLSGKKEEE